MTSLWDVTPYSPVDMYQRFGRKVFPLSSTLWMRAADSSETSVDTYRSTRRHNPGAFKLPTPLVFAAFLKCG